MSEFEFVMHWTMAAARRLKPVKTRPSGISEEIERLRARAGSLTATELRFWYKKLRWRIRTEWPPHADVLFMELDMCADQVEEIIWRGRENT